LSTAPAESAQEPIPRRPPPTSFQSAPVPCSIPSSGQDDPLVDTKVKILAIAFAAAREAAFVRFRFQISEADALDHAMKLAWHAIERRGWMDALDQSLLDAKLAEPEIDDRLLTREALLGFLVRKHWEGALAETREILNGFFKSHSVNNE
jgi:hypothetical protein